MHPVLCCAQELPADPSRLYEMLVRELTDFVVFLMDPTGCIVSWNPGVGTALGYTPEEWLGRSAEMIFTPEDVSQGKFREEMDKASREGRASDTRWHLCQNGERLFVEGTMVALRDENGTLLGFSKVMRDITERQQSDARNLFLVRLEEALRPLTATEEMMRVATQLLGEFLQVDSVAYCRLEADQESLHMVSDDVRSTAQGSVKSDLPLLFDSAVQESLQARQPYALEDVQNDPRKGDFAALYRQLSIGAYLAVPLHKDNQLVAALVVHQRLARRWRSEEVQLVQQVASRCWDFWERARIEAIQHRQWQTFHTALSNTPDLIYTFDRQGRFTYANRPFLELRDQPFEEVIGKNLFELGYPPEVAQKVSGQIQAVIEKRSIIRDQTPIITAAGESRYHEYILAPVLDEQGCVSAVCGSSRDVTEQHLTGEALRQSEERLTLALEASGAVGTWDWDLPNNRLYSDARFARLFSVDPERAAAGAPAEEYIAGIHPEDRALVRERIQLALETDHDYTVDYRVQPRGETERWVHSRGRCFRNQEGQPVRLPGVVIDITDRKRAEQEAKRANELHTRLIASSNDCIKLIGLDGTLLSLSENGRKQLGIEDPNSVLGTCWLDFWNGSDQVAASQAVAEARQGRFAEFEGCFESLGKSFWWHVALSPVMNDGKPELILAVSRNITQRRQQEETLRQVEQELRRSNEDLEQFARVAGHDLRAPVSTIVQFSQLLQRRYGGVLEEEGQSYLQHVIQGGMNISQLIDDLLLYAQVAQAEIKPKQPVSVQDACAQAKENLHASILASEASVLCNIAPEVKVKVEASRLTQVLQNLIGNAIHYRAEERRVLVRVSAESKGPFWQFAVSDNGPGIDPRFHKSIFEPFKRLHGQDKPGSGIGLSTCQRIIERAEGTIWVDSVLGQGSTFLFLLPKVI